MPATKTTFEGLLSPLQQQLIPEFCQEVTRIAKVLHGAREMGMDVPAFDVLSHGNFYTSEDGRFPAVKVHAPFPFGVEGVTAVRYEEGFTPTHCFTLNMLFGDEQVTGWDNLQPCQTVPAEDVAAELQQVDRPYMQRALTAQGAWEVYLSGYLEAILGGYVSIYHPGVRSEDGALYVADEGHGLTIVRPSGQVIYVGPDHPAHPDPLTPRQHA